MNIVAFPDTDSACDWREVGAANSGDVLVIESERVVGVACRFDFAVTVERGQMSEFLIDQPTGPKEFVQLVASIRYAVNEANRRGYAVIPELVELCR